MSFTVDQRRSVTLLAFCQALLLTNSVILMAVNALTGFMLADNKFLATLPAMTYVIGGAISAMPAAAYMREHGRRRGFMLGSVLAMVGAVICALAVMAKSFWGVCLGTFFIGCYNASGGFYRFAAADAVTGADKARAISLVLAGGIVGGLIGPESSKLTKDWLPVTYAGTYLSLVGFAIAALALQSRLTLPAVSVDHNDAPARPLREIIRQPKLIVAVVAAAFGYGVMNLLMVATPLAMSFCGHPFKEGVFVLEWHVFGMFAPSFFTGSLIKRFGALPIIVFGCLLNFATIAIDLSGTTVAHFWFGLFVLGVGWNFMYIGGTTLLTETYRPSERTRVQGFNDTVVFTTMAISSSSAGVLVNGEGWEIVNYTAAPFIAIALVAAIALALRSRRAAAAV
ncbi:MAG: MFS transporter [Burkholderiales bacterium]|nr:MFS transporter [Burkholderiales bacterium]